MFGIILGSILSFFAAFGIIEFIIFIYSEIGKKSDTYFVTIPVMNRQDEIEGIVRTAFLNSHSYVVVVDLGSTDGTRAILEKLKERYDYLTVLSYEEYTSFLKDKEQYVWN